MLYVVTACHNRKDITISLAETLIKQSYTDWRFLLIDDGSDDGTGDAIHQLLPDAIILRGDGNLWWGGALHLAYKWLLKNSTNGDAVFICNDDISFNEDFLSLGMKHLLSNENLIVVGNGYSKHNGKFLDGALLMNFSLDSSSLLPPGSTGNMSSTRTFFIKSEDMKRIGGFHPVLLPHYGSDYEYSIRAYKKGLTIRSYEDLNYIMDERTTGNKDRKDLTIKKLFSKKSQYNPVFRFTYFILTTPVHLIPLRFYSRLKRTIQRMRVNK